MRTRPITTIDPATLAGLRAYPLGEILDVRHDAPDFLLQGGVIAPGEQFAYQVSLRPGLNYHFSDIGAGPAFSVILVDSQTGEVLWANASGLRSLGVQTPAADLIRVAETRSVLMIVGGTSGADAPFAVAADASPIATDEFAVYRFLNEGNGQHFITAWEFERDYVLANLPSMRYQGVSFFAADEPLEGFTPVYRFANLINGSYLFTANEAERQSILEHFPFMRYDGIGFHVPGVPSEESVPVYRLANLKTGGYLYTSVLAEKAFFLLSGDWRDDGFSFFAVDPEAVATLATEVRLLQEAVDVPLVGLSAPEAPG